MPYTLTLQSGSKFPEVKDADTPNERTLNVFAEVEPLLMKYIESNPEDKEVARKVLADVRKCLARTFGALPPTKKEKPVVAPTAPNPERWW